MKHQQFYVHILRFVAVAFYMAIAALFVTLIMFSGVTGAIGSIAWMIICWPMLIMDHYVWNFQGTHITLQCVIVGLFWALCFELLLLVAPRRRK
jgi:hypothetical protein